MSRQSQSAFTLVELLTVVAVVGILSALLTSTFHYVRESARGAYCANNLRQLHHANTAYADDHGFYVAAAPDIFTSNRRRWHGVRSRSSEAFDGSRGPLAAYLGYAGTVRTCPSFAAHSARAAANAFEAACGGYGYNMVGVGSQIYLFGMTSAAVVRGMPPHMIRNPGETVMFADAAFPQPYGNRPTHWIEYSFLEPYHWVFAAGRESSFRADPSIHFRHRGKAQVVWCDGRVSRETLETTAEPHFTDMAVGWFGPPDNTLFSPN